MGDVIKGEFATTLDLPVERVIEGAAAADLEAVVIVGLDRNGEVVVFGSKQLPEGHLLLSLGLDHLLTMAKEFP